MNIQIFGKNKCFDTKKAERYFKERRIPFQRIDLLRYGMSRGEITSVMRAVGWEAMTDFSGSDSALIRYLATDEARIDALFEHPEWLRTPIVRNGKQATVGARPEVWETWK